MFLEHGTGREANRQPDSEWARVGESAEWASDCDARSVEPGKGETAEFLVISCALLFKDADGRGFAEWEGLHRVRPPMDAGHISPDGDIGCKLVQLSTHSQRQSGERLQSQTIGRGLDGIGNQVGFVKPG